MEKEFMMLGLRKLDGVSISKFEQKFGEIDNHLFYLIETPFSQVMTILQSGTLFSNGVCVVCKNAELLKKKDDIEMLQDILMVALNNAFSEVDKVTEQKMSKYANIPGLF